MDLCPDSNFQDTFYSLISILASTSFSSLITYKFYRSFFGSQHDNNYVVTNENLIKKQNGTVAQPNGHGHKTRNGINSHLLIEEVTSKKVPEIGSINIEPCDESSADENDGTAVYKELISKLNQINEKQLEMNSKGTKSESDLEQSIEIDDPCGDVSDPESVNLDPVEDQISNNNYNEDHNSLDQDLEESNRVEADDSYIKIIESVTGFMNQVPSFQPSDSFASFVVVDKITSDIKVISLSISGVKNEINGLYNKKFSRISINDTRPAVIAKRSLVKYIYQELFLFNQQKDYNLIGNQRSSVNYKQTSDLNHNVNKYYRNSYENWSSKYRIEQPKKNFLLERCSDGNGYQIKSNFDLYLIVSKTHVDDMENERKMRKKKRNDSLGNLLYEKLIQWSCLGVQGSILSHLIKPIFINAIIIPSNSRAKKLHSAQSNKFEVLEQIFCNFNENGKLKGTEFDFRPPNVIGLKMDMESMIRSPSGRPQSNISGSSSGSNNNSNRSSCISVIRKHGHGLNNGLDDVDIEYIYTDTGCTPNGHSSKLSKSSLFDEFGRLTFCRKTLSTVEWSKFYPSYPLNYIKVKTNSIPYRIIKEQLVNNGIGSGHVHEKNENNFNAFDPK